MGAALAAACVGPAVAQAAKTPLPDGMVGEFHPAAGGRRTAAVLVLGGSEGGVAGSAPLARLLSEHGFNALALAYFGAPGLPATLQNIPLEYFRRAVDWLAAQPSVDPRRIGVLGGSKGAEAALLIASRDRRLRAVVAGAPSSIAWSGINPADFAHAGPSWTAGGAAVACATYDMGAPFNGVLDFYTRSLAKAPAAATILVEKIHGPVLLVSGREDQLWPSTLMAEAIMVRLDAARFAYPHRHLAYDHAGHPVLGPPPPANSPNLARLASLGGTVEGNVAARVDAWPKALQFLDEALKA